MDDYVQTGDPSISQYDWSIEILIKCDNFSNSPIFLSPLSSGVDHFLRFLSNGKIAFQVTTSSDLNNRLIDSNYTASLGEILHLVFTRTSTSKSIYINGILDAQDSDSTSSALWSGSWRLGSRGNNTFHFNGNIYIVKVYNQLLTEQEIQQNYNANKSRFGL